MQLAEAKAAGSNQTISHRKHYVAVYRNYIFITKAQTTRDRSASTNSRNGTAKSVISVTSVLNGVPPALVIKYLWPTSETSIYYKELVPGSGTRRGPNTSVPKDAANPSLLTFYLTHKDRSFEVVSGNVREREMWVTGLRSINITEDTFPPFTVQKNALNGAPSAHTTKTGSQSSLNTLLSLFSTTGNSNGNSTMQKRSSRELAAREPHASPNRSSKDLAGSTQGNSSKELVASMSGGSKEITGPATGLSRENLPLARSMNELSGVNASKTEGSGNYIYGRGDATSGNTSPRQNRKGIMRIFQNRSAKQDATPERALSSPIL